MVIQITKEELLKELSKRTWLQTNKIIRPIVFLYPFLSIVDYLCLPDLWFSFFIARLITVLAILGFYEISRKKNINYRILLHFTIFILSITTAYKCSITPVAYLNIYFCIYSAIILFFNLQVFWEPVQSITQSVIALLLSFLFFALNSHYSFEVFFSNGGLLFTIIVVASCFIPISRFKVTEDDVRSKILIEKSNEQLTAQNQAIVEKNNIIDSQYERLLKLDENKNSFINIAGHDLKNLLGSIKMSNTLIKEEESRLSDDQKEYLEYIAESADKMNHLLNNLMDVKKIASDEMKLNPEIFEVNTEVRNIFKGLVETAESKNIQLVDHIAREPINVKLDKVFTGQIFQNLLSNTIKFSKSDSIRIATGIQRGKFVFEINDDGRPIGQEELDAMFNKLKDLNDTSGSDSREGLGLSIAKLMTYQMGGDIYYRSDSNGNYFRVEFELAA